MRLPFAVSHFLGELFQLAALPAGILNLLQLLKPIPARTKQHNGFRKQHSEKTKTRERKRFKILTLMRGNYRRCVRRSPPGPRWSPTTDPSQPQCSDSAATARSDWGIWTMQIRNRDLILNLRGWGRKPAVVISVEERRKHWALSCFSFPPSTLMIDLIYRRNLVISEIFLIFVFGFFGFGLNEFGRLI